MSAAEHKVQRDRVRLSILLGVGALPQKPEKDAVLASKCVGKDR